MKHIVTILSLLFAFTPAIATTEVFEWTTNNVTFKYEVTNGEASILANGYSGRVDFPAYVGESNIPVTALGTRDDFSEAYPCLNNSITSIKIPRSVHRIILHSANDISGLQEVHIEDIASWCNLDTSSNLLYYNPMLFLNGKKVTDVSIPDGVREIRNDLFYGQSTLTSVKIPDGITRIGANAFNRCDHLSEITIPNSVTNIEEWAFERCFSLTNVLLGIELKNIGPHAFWKCTGIKEIAIPSEVESIGAGAFTECSGLTRLNLGSGVKRICEHAFSHCSLSTISVPASVSTIERYAFSYNSSLRRIIFEGNEPSVNYDLFVSWQPLNCPIYVSADAQGYDVDDDGKWQDLKVVRVKTQMENNIEWAYCDCDGGVEVCYIANEDLMDENQEDLIIPTNLDGGMVVRIGDNAFMGCHHIKRVEIPSGVASVGTDAFRGCDSIASVAISHDICNLRLLDVFPDAYRKIEDIVISDDVTSIGDNVFCECTGLTSITIPDSVTSIGDSAFAGCCGLTNIMFKGNAPRVGYYAFSNVSSKCAGYVTIGSTGWGTLPGTWEGLHIECLCAHDGNTLLVDALAPTCTEEGYTGNTVCAICGSVLEVGSTISALRHIMGNGVVTTEPTDFEEGVRTYYCTRCYAVLKVEPIPSLLPPPPTWTKDSDGELIEADIKGLSKAIIPDGVTRIGEGVLYDCENLRSITIPDSVEAIAPTAFDDCEKLWAKWFKMLERMSGNDAAIANEVTLTVTNVVVHYVTTAAVSEAVTPSEDVGIVNVIAEVRADNKPVAVSSAWAAQYGDAFTEKFGKDFAAAVTATTGKRDGAGNAMMVWQDYVAGTDPTDENDKFTASITFDADGKPQIAYSPKFTNEAEAAKRKYTTYGKVKLTDNEWTPIADGEEGNYNFFKVTVEMR